MMDELKIIKENEVMLTKFCKYGPRYCKNLGIMIKGSKDKYLPFCVAMQLHTDYCSQIVNKYNECYKANFDD